LGKLRGRLGRPAQESPAPAAAADLYARWIASHDVLTPEDEARIRAAFGADAPTVAVLIDGRNASGAELQRTLGSAKAQWYPALTTIVAPLGPAALDEVKADFVLPIQAGDTLRPHAAACLVAALEGHPRAPFAYGDEDVVDGEGRRTAPYFKTEFDPDLLLAQDYAAMPALYRLPAAKAAGGLGTLPPRAALYDLCLGAAGGGTPVHAPLILAHRSAKQGDDAALAGAMATAAARAVSREAPDATVEPLAGLGRRVRWTLPQRPPLVSLIIPTRDRVNLLRTCVEGLLHDTNYPEMEILVVDNDSAEPETLTYLDSLASDRRVKVIRHPGPFNYSLINNRAAAAAHGQILGLINNDLKVLEPDWLKELAGQALRAEVGAVGPLLYYGHGTVQHAGCVLGIGGVASHVFKGFDPDDPGHGDWLRRARGVSAVTGACLLTRREIWEALGGLDETLSVAYNDIDYCLRVRASGRRVVWTPHARLYHLESATRGEDKTGERRERLEAEKAKMAAKWGPLLAEDPFYSANLSQKRTDASPAFPPRSRPFWKSLA
jgi:GT2 family glycosyltransferase